MLDAKVVIAGAIVALVVIYFLPRLDLAARKVYGRHRRKKRDLRQQKEREEQLARRAQSR